MRRLTNYEVLDFVDLLKPIFKSRNSFVRLLSRVDHTYEEFERRDDTLPDVITEVVREANAWLWWSDLLREARNMLPGDGALAQFAAPFGLAPELVAPGPAGFAPLSGQQLQLKITEANCTFDIGVWRKRLGEIEGQVCRIEYPAGTPRGTGFLIGPNAVMTNFHVVEGIKDPENIRLRFDYKVLDDGIAVGKGLVYSLAAGQDWLYDSSPYSPEDTKLQPQDPGTDQLDYAILRVQGTPGNDFIGGNTTQPDPNAIRRDWIRPYAAPYDFLATKALYIVEHPDGKPMQVAVNTNAVIRVNGNATRVRYRTETQPGSSGSPCFGPNWDWVAIHHSGDPKYYQGAKPEFNQGIPVAAIRNLIESKKLKVFGEMI